MPVLFVKQRTGVSEPPFTITTGNEIVCAQFHLRLSNTERRIIERPQLTAERGVLAS